MTNYSEKTPVNGILKLIPISDTNFKANAFYFEKDELLNRSKFLKYSCLNNNGKYEFYYKSNDPDDHTTYIETFYNEERLKDIYLVYLTVKIEKGFIDYPVFVHGKNCFFIQKLINDFHKGKNVKGILSYYKGNFQIEIESYYDEIEYTKEEIIAIKRFQSGEKYSISTFIDEDTIIMGYGGMNEHSYDFKYPLPAIYTIQLYGTLSWTEYFKEENKKIEQYLERKKLEQILKETNEE